VRRRNLSNRANFGFALLGIEADLVSLVERGLSQP